MATNGHKDVIIEVRGLSVGFGDNLVLDKVDLDVYRGEILGFVGGSGAGKSVLMRTIIGLLPRRAGTIKIFGIDPLYVANEGKLVAVVSPEAADEALGRLGGDAAIVGELAADPPGLVLLETVLGGSRIVDMLVGDPLPRIC